MIGFFLTQRRKGAKDWAFLILALAVASVVSGQSSFAANVSFTFTNSLFQPDTNYFKVIPVSGPVANADGSFTTIGSPIRVNPNSSGVAVTNLAQNNYQVTNAFLGQGYYIRVPLDSGPTIYPSGSLLISGGNMFVTVMVTNGGTNGNLSFNQITNGLGKEPIGTTNLPALTNGFVGKEITNNASTLQQLEASTNNFTPLVFTNVSQVLYTNALPALTNGHVGKEITNNALTVGQFNTGTNGFVGKEITNNAATVGQLQASTNNLSPLVLTNVSQVLYTNALPALTNGHVGKEITNNALTVGQFTTGTNGFVGKEITNNAATRGELNSASNSLQSQIGSGSGGITLAQATNAATTVTNGYSGLVFTNVTQVLYTNALPALTNGHVGKEITNNALTVGQFTTGTNGFVGKEITNNALTVGQFNTGTNGFVGKEITNSAATVGQLVASTNSFSPLVLTNVGQVLYTNALPALTNGYVGKEITNGITSTAFFPTNVFLGATNGVGNNLMIYNGITFTNSSGQAFRLGIGSLNDLTVTPSGGSTFSGYGGDHVIIPTVQAKTNLVIGLATNIISDTNILYIYAAGSAIAAQGGYEWAPLLRCYTNIFTHAIGTNNGTQWLIQTNGVTLYSSATLINAAWAGVNGIGTASSVYGFSFMTDGVIFRGWFSYTNLLAMINAASNSLGVNGTFISPTNIYPPWVTSSALDANTNLTITTKSTNASSTGLVGDFIWQVLANDGSSWFNFFLNPYHNGNANPSIDNSEAQISFPMGIATCPGFGDGHPRHFQWGIGGVNESDPAHTSGTYNYWSYNQACFPYGATPGYSLANTYKCNFGPGGTVTPFPGFVSRTFTNDGHWELDEFRDLNVSDGGLSGDTWSINTVVYGNEYYEFTNSQYRGNLFVGAMPKEKRNASAAGAFGLDFGTSTLMDIAAGSSSITFFTTNAYLATNTGRWNESWFVVRANGNVVTLNYPVGWNTNISGAMPTNMTGDKELVLHLLSTGTGETNIIVQGASVHFNALFAPDPLFAQYSLAAGATNWAVNTLLTTLRTAGLINTNGACYPMLPDNGSNSCAINLFGITNYNLVFFGTNAYTNGLGGDGVSGYGDTHLTPSTAGWNASNVTMYVYASTNYTPTSNMRMMGAVGGASFGIQYVTGSGWLDSGVCDNTAGNLASSSTLVTGDMALVRTNSIQTEVGYFGGGPQSASVNAVAAPNVSFYVGARDFGGLDHPFKGNVKFALVIPQGITATQWSTLTNAVANYLGSENRYGLGN